MNRIAAAVAGLLAVTCGGGVHIPACFDCDKTDDGYVVDPVSPLGVLLKCPAPNSARPLD